MRGEVVPPQIPVAATAFEVQDMQHGVEPTVIVCAFGVEDVVDVPRPGRTIAAAVDDTAFSKADLCRCEVLNCGGNQAGDLLLHARRIDARRAIRLPRSHRRAELAVQSRARAE